MENTYVHTADFLNGKDFQILRKQIMTKSAVE